MTESGNHYYGRATLEFALGLAIVAATLMVEDYTRGWGNEYSQSPHKLLDEAQRQWQNSVVSKDAYIAETVAEIMKRLS